MKAQIPAIATALVLALGSASALDFTTQHGVTYSDCRVRAVTLDGVQIVTTQKKRVMIDFSDLPIDLQAKFQYDVHKANTDPQAAATYAYRAWQKQPLSFKQQFTMSSAPTSEQAGSTKEPRQREPANAKASHDAAVDASQREAVDRYPSLGIMGSPMNNLFVEQFNKLWAVDPGYIASANDWPLKLANQCATRLAEDKTLSASVEKTDVSPRELQEFPTLVPDVEGWCASVLFHKSLWHSHEVDLQAIEDQKMQLQRDKAHEAEIKVLRARVKEGESRIEALSAKANAGVKLTKGEFEKTEDFDRRLATENATARENIAKAVAAEGERLASSREALANEIQRTVKPIPRQLSAVQLPSRFLVQVAMDAYDADTERAKGFSLVFANIFPEEQQPRVLTTAGKIGGAAIPLKIAKLLGNDNYKLWASIETPSQEVSFENTWISPADREANLTAHIAEAKRSGKAALMGLGAMVLGRLLHTETDTTIELAGDAMREEYGKEPQKQTTAPVPAKVIKIEWKGIAAPIKLLLSQKGDSQFYMIWSAEAK